MADDVSVSFGASIERLIKATEDSKRAIESVKDSVDKVTEGAKSLLEMMGVAFSVEAIVHFIEKMGELGLQTERTMATLGLTAQQTVDLGGVAKLTGTSMEALTVSLGRMALNMQKSTKDAFNPAAQGLKALGLTAKEFTNLNTDQYIDKWHDAVSKFNPSMNLFAAVAAAGGKGIAQMLPFLQVSKEHWNEMKVAVAAANEGLAAAIPGMANTHEKLTLMGLSAQSFGARLFTVLKPAIDGAITWMTNFIQSMDTKAITAALQKIGSVTLSIIESIGSFAITAMGSISDLGQALDQLSKKLSLIATGAAAGGFLGALGSGVGAVPGAILGGAVGAGVDSIRQWFEGSTKIVIEGSDKLEQRRAAFAKTVAGYRAAIESFTAAAESNGGHGESGKKDAGGMNIGGMQQLQALLASIDAQIAIVKQGFERQKLLYSADAANFKITQGEKFNLLEGALQQEFQAELAALQRKLAVIPGAEIKMRADIEKKIIELREKTKTEMLKLDLEMFAAERAVIAGYMGSVEHSWNSSLQGMLAGTVTFGQAIKKVFADFVMYAIQQIEKKFIFEKLTTALTEAMHIQSEAAKTAATGAGAGARAAAEAASAGASMAAEKTADVSSISGSVGRFIAAVSAFLAPEMGPAAPAAAAAEGAALEATALSMAAFEGGAWEVPSTGVAMIHKGETVLPSAAAQTFRDMADGNSGRSGGDTYLIGNIDSSFMNLMRQNKDAAAEMLRRMVREGQFKPA